MRLKDVEVFKDYSCYKNYHKGMNRWQVCLVKKGDRNNRKTILYSKYVMSIEVGRILTSEEEVDHVDGDKTNDCLSNLEIVTREENVRRRYEKNKAKTVEVECPECGLVFERLFKNTHLAPYRKTTMTFCSRKCSGKFNGRK